MESPVALLLLLLLCLGALAPTPGSASSEAPPLVNEDVKRTVDLSSHLAKVTAEVVLVHPGGGSTSRASSFVLALEPELESRLAHLGVQVSGGRSRRTSRGMPEAIGDPWGGAGRLRALGILQVSGCLKGRCWRGTAERLGSAVSLVRVSSRTRQHKLPSVGHRPRGCSGAQGDPLVPWRPPSAPQEDLGCGRVRYFGYPASFLSPGLARLVEDYQ
jgi:hypothetical protein